MIADAQKIVLGSAVKAAFLNTNRKRPSENSRKEDCNYTNLNDFFSLGLFARTREEIRITHNQIRITQV